MDDVENELPERRDRIALDTKIGNPESPFIATIGIFSKKPVKSCFVSECTWWISY
jgi:hypothetical protein